MNDEQARLVAALRKDIDEWLAANSISSVVQDEMRGFVHRGVQLSVTVDVDAGDSFVLVGAIVLSATERAGRSTRDDLQTCINGLPDPSPVVLAIGSPDHTIWACEGFALDDFDLADFREIVDHLAEVAVRLGPAIQAQLGGGMLGTEARVTSRLASTDDSRPDVRERLALQREEDFARFLEHRLRLPRGSLQVTRTEPAASVVTTSAEDSF